MESIHQRISMTGKYLDGLQSLTNQMANTRNPSVTNRVVSSAVDKEELNAIYKTGLGGKIVRIKSSHVFKEGFTSESEKSEEFVNKKMTAALKKATVWMLAFGRGVVLIDNGDKDLMKPLTSVNTETVKFKTFSGYDTTTSVSNTNDITDDRYYKPTYYYIRGATIHYSRIIDLTYIEPVDDDKAYI